MPPPGKEPSEAVRTTRTASRTWLFRGFAILAPVVLLLAAEAVLRGMGKRRPTEFWLPADQPGFIQANPAFAATYVGDVLARMPRPIQIARQKPAGIVRVLVLGESAALGDPEPAFGMPRFLEAILESRYPGRRVEVVNAAITALNSHALRRIAADSKSLGADFWVVYPGNNEVHGPFGPANGPTGKVPPLSVVRASLALRDTAIGQLAFGFMGSGGGSEGNMSLAPRWAGLEMFSENRVGADDARLSAVWHSYRENLADIVRIGTESGAQVILGTMAVNLPDSPPFASSDAGDTNSATYKEWEAASAKAGEHDEKGEWPNAVEEWTRAATLRKDHAETVFHLGLAKLNARDSAAGRKDLERARDLDTLRFRADSRIIELTREVASAAAASGKVTLVDADRELKGSDPYRPPGADIFYEHVHLRPEGNYQLARMFADAIGTKLAGGNSTNTPSLEQCQTRLGWTPQGEARIWTQIRSLCQRPPFSLQSHSEARARYLDDRITEANTTARRVGLNGSVRALETTLAQHPEDWQLGEQLARQYHAGRRWTNALPLWKRVVMAAPNNVMAWHNLGEAFSKTGDKDSASAAFAKALDIRPDFVDASISLGLLFGDSRQMEAALRSFDQALRYDPTHMQARINRALTLEAMGRYDEAVAELLRAGAEHPESAIAYSRLGEVLSARKNYTGAVDAFQEAVRRDPSNAALLQRLAGELARAGRPEQSEALLRKAVDADPNLVSARVDLGVALARQMRFSDAIVEFEAVLRLQPGHPTAQTYLERARSMMATKRQR